MDMFEDKTPTAPTPSNVSSRLFDVWVLVLSRLIVAKLACDAWVGRLCKTIVISTRLWRRRKFRIIRRHRKTQRPEDTIDREGLALLASKRSMIDSYLR